ncbi:MAG TPA: glycosyltransferase family 39 protein [Solirubrobacterales bacterium]|nr:glycosyltransferase family 39 protein [Solirubrobacterales bacterium]
MLDRREDGPRWLMPAAIVIVALVVRIAVIAADSGYEPANDAFEYDYYARSIASGDGYERSGYLLQGGPTAIRGPGYPYFLGAVYALTDDSVASGRVAGALLGALTVLLLYLLVRRIWGRRVGLVAAGLAAIFPPLALLSRDLLSEVLFLPLALGALLCVLNFRRSGGDLRWAVAAGGLSGTAALTRNTGLLVLACVALGVWTLRPRLRPRALAAPLGALACAALVIAPWTIRNAKQFGEFVPLTTAGGFATAGTYNAASYAAASTHGAWRTPQIVPEYRRLFLTPGIDEAGVDDRLREEVRDFAWEHPGYVAEATGWNLLRLFEISGGSVVNSRGEPVTERGIGSAIPVAERIALALAVALAAVGLIAVLRAQSAARDRSGPPSIPAGPLFFWLVPVLVVLASAPIAGLPRYRVPADPFLLTAAAIGLVVLSGMVIQSRRQS